MEALGELRASVAAQEAPEGLGAVARLRSVRVAAKTAAVRLRGAVQLARELREA
jgi:hypothetical protein